MLRVLPITLFFLVGSIAHFVVTDTFVGIMPDYLSAKRELVWISGLFELLGAVGVLIRRIRRAAGIGLILLCIAVFPANLHMALHSGQFQEIPTILLYLRLPLQLLIIWYIWWATRPRPHHANR